MRNLRLAGMNAGGKGPTDVALPPRGTVGGTRAIDLPRDSVWKCPRHATLKEFRPIWNALIQPSSSLKEASSAVNGITEEVIHRGFVFGHLRGGRSLVGPAILHTSTNTPAIILALPEEIMATALVMHMAVILVSVYLVFLVRAGTPNSSGAAVLT